MKETILLVGGAGYIGSHTGYLLYQRGYNVIIIDSFLHNQNFNVNWAKVVRADIADLDLVKNLFASNNISAVMHFAAFIEVGESVKFPSKFYNNNVTNMLNLLNIMLDYNVSNIVFSSSCAVYGIPQQTPMTEAHPRNPVNTYGKTKLCMEFALEDYAAAYDLCYANLRYFNAAGALPEKSLGEQHDPESHVIPLLLRALQQESKFKVFGTNYDTRDGTCIRDYIHVIDLAEAHIKALEFLCKKKSSIALNLGSGKGYSVYELIRTAEQVVGKKAMIENMDSRDGDVSILLADNTLAKKVLGWLPQYSDLAYILQTAYAWEQKKYMMHTQNSFRTSGVNA